MAFTVQFGFWLIPAFVTIAAFWLPHYWSRHDKPAYGADIAGAIMLLASAIVSLFAWLVWALAVLWLS